MKCPYCIKVCTKCKRILVAYNGNFYTSKKGKYGFRADCKECKAKYDNQHYQENKEQKTEYNKQYYQENREQILEQKKEYNQENKEQKTEYNKQYYQENREQMLEYNKQYRTDNPHIFFNNHIKRRSKLENQGRGITKEQWFEMMCWFDWCCAYSGEYIGNEENKNIRSIDHIIALDNNGLNEPWNCVPMFRPYNSSKSIKNMEEWYVQQEFYSEERLQKIYAWCEYALNKWKIAED